MTRAIAALFFAPFVLLIVALRPLVLVRFGTMMSRRIGHFVVDTEVYLVDRDRQNLRRRIVDIVGCPEPSCNRQLRIMWGRAFPIARGVWPWRTMELACRFWTGGDLHSAKIVGGGPYPYFPTAGTHLCFIEEEHNRAGPLLRRLGIPAGARWICIHNRDSAYLDKALSGAWEYHGYRDFSVRTMIAAAEELSRRGYYVVRVGSVVENELRTNDPKIIDYANSPLRSDFLDVYLLAHGAFYVGNDSGLFCIPWVFGKPVLKTNFTIMNVAGLPANVVIFKRIYSRQKKKLLNLTEMYEAGLWGASEMRLFERAGVELVCNSPEEIRDASIELDDRLRGTWRPETEDAALQQRFWEIFHKYAPRGVTRGDGARVGAAFLRMHTDLLQ